MSGTVSNLIIQQFMAQKEELETGIKVLDKIIDDKNKELEELKNKYDVLYRKYCLLLDKNDDLETTNQTLLEKVTIYENGIYHIKESVDEMDMMLLSEIYEED